MSQQVTVDAGALRRGIALASTVMHGHRSIPILSAVKVTANGAFVLQSTDLDNHARIQLADADYQSQGKNAELSFALPSPLHLRSAIHHSGADYVNIKRSKGEDRKVHFAAGSLTADLSTMPADDFPTLEAIHFQKFAATLGAAELRQIARVTAAISTEETRYYLNGVCVRKVGEWLWQFAATDGYRLMTVDVALPDADGSIPDDTIIPAEWIALALRNFAKTKTGAQLTFGNTLVRNVSDGTTLPIDKPGGPRISIDGDVGGMKFALTGKLIDATYPNYSRIIPTGYTHVARMPRADLVRAVRALSGFSNEKHRAIKLTFESDAVVVSLHSPDLGEGKFRVWVEHNLGSGFIIGMNGRYLLDNLAAFDGPEIELHFEAPSEKAPSAPVLFLDPADTAFRAILMPMRV